MLEKNVTIVAMSLRKLVGDIESLRCGIATPTLTRITSLEHVIEQAIRVGLQIRWSRSILLVSWYISDGCCTTPV